MIIVRAPLTSPAQPSPATARPMMNMVEEVDAPHMADPISKTKKKVKNVHCKRHVNMESCLCLAGKRTFKFKFANIFPVSGWTVALCMSTT